MLWTRRKLLAMLAASPGGLLGQRAAPRGVKAMPRAKPSGAPFAARFTDVAEEAGLRAPVFYGAVGRKQYLLETIGCGCAFLDYDNDGWLDIFLLSGSRVEGAPEGAGNRLYKNNRDGTFTDVTEKAGLRRSGWASAVCVGDYDNDGYPDLFLTYWGQNVLYRNNRDGSFTDVTREAGLLDRRSRWGAGCTFLDYDRDGHLDLFVANYLEFDLKTAPRPSAGANCAWKGVQANCGPRGLPEGRHSLYRNNGDGTFTEVSRESGIAKARGGYGLTVLAADFDNDGWPDILVACDSTPSLLFRNNHDGTFTEEALERGLAISEEGLEQAGLGLALGDFDLDGNLDLFKTRFTEDTDLLYHNDGQGVFEDVTSRAGLGVETRFAAWGAGLADLDNDGLPDLFLVSASVPPAPGKRVPDDLYRTPRVIFRNLGNGRFEELIEQAGPGVAAPHASRGCAFGDFDNDGDLDILIVNLNEPPSLLRNDLSGNHHWLKVKLIGSKSNRSAIGARVTASYGGRRQAQEVLSQSGFFSASDTRLHFGLGSAATADLEIRWPSGGAETIRNVTAGQLVTIREGAGIIKTGFTTETQR